MDTRLPDEATKYRELFDRMMMQVNTCIPGVVEEFFPSTQTCHVKPVILMKTVVDGEQGVLEYPKIINAPLIFPFAITKGFALTLPVSKGDPCVIFFSQRSFENWHRMGGIQPPEAGISSRHHDITDALVLLAAPPQPNALTGWEGEGIEIRNTAKTSRVTVKNDLIDVECGPSKMTMNSDGTVTVNATVSATITTPESYFNGNVTVSGLLTTGGFNSLGNYNGGGPATFYGGIVNTTGDIVSDDISLEGHVHIDTQPGTGTSGTPT